MSWLTHMRSSRYTPPTPAQKLTAVSADGARIQVEVHGSEQAPTVVLAHGWTCRIGFWAPVTRALAVDHRVVLYDQRGHGSSPLAPIPGGYSTRVLADDLQAVLETALQDGERAVVAGHSMGGMSVLAAADREAVRKRAAAVLLCSTASSRLLSDSRVVPLRSPRLRTRVHRALLGTRAPLGPVTPLSKQILKYVTMSPGATREMVEACAHVVHACPTAVRAGWARVLADLDLTPQVTRLSMPTAVLVGTADRLTPPEHARRMAAALPRCVGLTELPGLGHMTPLEAPQTVAGAVRSLVHDHLTAPATEPVNQRSTFKDGRG
ncbi:pimeloyl-ACP methyl ester carboxylesterase [Streptomyces sp. V4I8]|uniref:alpha/beta fold hydrolase n=1 Tax=Streptomyces sp. V4I8 TaxID=3156469 RepID=UPI003515E1DB